MIRRRGFFATFIGCCLGGIALGFFGGFLGGLYVERYMPYAELDGIAPVFFGALAGSGLGAGIGSWLALRLRGYRNAVMTGFLVCVSTPLLQIGLWLLVARMDVPPGNFTLWIVPGLAALVASAAARALVVASVRSDWDEPPRESRPAQ